MHTLHLVFMDGFANILNYLFKLLTVVLQGISVRVGCCFNWKKKRIDKVLRTGTGDVLLGVNWGVKTTERGGRKAGRGIS